MTRPLERSANFQVDLHGLVELLSRNLYSGPRVFVRELLQNGVDAITSRQEFDPRCPTRITFTIEDSGTQLTITDSGVGLTLDEAERLLATIGASSKRDELGFARTDFLGQFGIGLLSCFMVSDRIVVRSRSARSQDAQTISWIGNADGTWQAGPAPAPLAAPGTEISLRARENHSLFTPTILRQLLREYGQFLGVEVILNPAAEQVSLQQAPWEMNRAQQNRWCSENFGFQPFDTIRLEVPQAGLTGVGFVLDASAHPGRALKHHVYVRRMHLSNQVRDLTPEWAYFVRIVADTQFLRPTASREALFDDDLLSETRDKLGGAIRDWLAALHRDRPDRFAAFVSTHLDGLLALAVRDEPTRALVAAHVPFDTSFGPLTIDHALARFGKLRFARTTDQFKALRSPAAAGNICLLNAGTAFVEELLGQLILDRATGDIALLDPAEILDTLHPPTPEQERDFGPLLAHARASLASQVVDVVLRSFEPATLPLLYLPDPDLAGRVLANSARAQASGAWADLLGVVDPFANSGRPQLVLNANAGIVHRLAASTDGGIQAAAIRGLYVQALTAGRHPLNPEARAWATDVFATLIDATLKGRP